ncbi:hypothetical protein E4U54_005023 [Claviceps lovelessii]|nr:hypothetical protein E4U54_005023 [Claviceps lovelessii]
MVPVPADPNNVGPQINIPTQTGRVALLWTSIGAAVFTSLIQGLITTIVQVAEDQSLWTFRFRIARFEHWWWTAVSVLLSISFAFIILTFLAGNSQDAVGVLALSTATTIAIVRFTVPAWRNRVFIENRWLAWTGPNRTSIRRIYRDLCGDAKQWERLARAHPQIRTNSAPSDDWGLTLIPPKGLWEDPTAILEKFGEDKEAYMWAKLDAPCVYDDGDIGDGDVSLRWGEDQGFRRRVSRAINAMPAGLLTSYPTTTDGYKGEGLCLAYGILGRNKGLRPNELRFDASDSWKRSRGIRRHRENAPIRAVLENSSSWAPRPNKVMRSYYSHAVREQFGTLSADFQEAATELALILLDIRPRELRMWLNDRFEQQAMDVNHYLSGRNDAFKPAATNAELATLYRASYTSMIISLNYYLPLGRIRHNPLSVKTAVRPDLTCFALLYLAEHAVSWDPDAEEWVEGAGAPMPAWWQHNWVRDRLQHEQESLKPGWKEPAAWLLGLKSFPPELEFSKEAIEWPLVRYVPDKTTTR